MIMSGKCCNNNSDNPLTSHRTDGGKKQSDILTRCYGYIWREKIRWIHISGVGIYAFLRVSYMKYTCEIGICPN